MKIFWGFSIVIAISVIIGCDTARNLVEPIDHTPIETTGETKFAVTIKSVDNGYETTIRLTDIIILDAKGNELPITGIDDIVINSGGGDSPDGPESPNGGVNTDEQYESGKWWLDQIWKKDPSYKGLDCDDTHSFYDDTAFDDNPDTHLHQNVIYTHKHRHYDGTSHRHNPDDPVVDSL